MSTAPLTTNFKDDILASSNPKRKYQIIYNDDGTVCLEDVTVYSQTGSTYGAKEVNEERAAINNIDERRIVTLDEIDLVTEEGFFVDALAVAELNKKTIVCEIDRKGIGANYYYIAAKEGYVLSNVYNRNYDICNTGISYFDVQSGTYVVHLTGSLASGAIMQVREVWIKD